MSLFKEDSSQINLIDKARYEIKFVTESSLFFYISHWIKNHDMGFFEEYPSRSVNNIYFDNHNLDSYIENLSGISSRSKIRLRWYGKLHKSNSQKSKLELKIKKNKLGWKYAEDIFFSKNLKDITKTELLRSINDQLSEKLKHRFNISDTPVLINSYKRFYYVSMNKKVRITLDKDLSFYDQRVHNKLNFTYMVHSPNICVLEFKSAKNDIDFCRKALENVFLQPSKCSKYVLGVQRILGV